MSETLTDKTLETLELETGAIGCISPERHQKRWLQKSQSIENQIAAANSPAQKRDLEAKLTEINRIESKKAALIVDIYHMNSAPISNIKVDLSLD
jgi:ABC-type xylose transport system substrate-binding protein